MNVIAPPQPDAQETRAIAASRRELSRRVKDLLVRRLDIEVDPAMIADDQPLFGRGLELDSIDTLELAIAIQEEFAVELTDDNVEAMLSVSRLVDHIETRLWEHRER